MKKGKEFYQPPTKVKKKFFFFFWGGGGKSNFIADFEAFLKNKKGCSNNTTCIYITPLRKMISIAINNGWLVCDPFFNYRISIQRKDRVYLTMNEIESIANMQFTKFRKNYELIQDLFVFCSFTNVALNRM